MTGICIASGSEKVRHVREGRITRTIMVMVVGNVNLKMMIDLVMTGI